MKNRKKILNIAKSVISIEQEAISDLGKRLSDDFPNAVELILSSEGRVIVTGVG